MIAEVAVGYAGRRRTMYPQRERVRILSVSDGTSAVIHISMSPHSAYSYILPFVYVRRENICFWSVIVVV